MCIRDSLPSVGQLPVAVHTGLQRILEQFIGVFLQIFSDGLAVVKAVIVPVIIAVKQKGGIAAFTVIGFKGLVNSPQKIPGFLIGALCIQDIYNLSLIHI